MTLSEARSSGADCKTVGDVGADAVRSLLARYGIDLVKVAAGEPIEATFWGEPEAGIAGQTVYARDDTPVHSVLHEACHVICMPASRRRSLYRNAGGDDLEEAAVCYLEIVLAGFLPGVGSRRLMQDMDAWGYSFRLGSAARWFHEDADDARDFLVTRGILNDSGTPTWNLSA